MGDNSPPLSSLTQPSYIVNFKIKYMKEPVYWTTRDGVKMNVDDMDNTHIRNAFKMLIKQVEQFRKGIAQLEAQERAKKEVARFQIHGEIAREHIEQEILNELMGDELDELYGG